MKIINPATATLISTVAPDTIETIQEKLALLKKGQLAWAKWPLNDRISALERFSGYLQQHLEACAQILSMEVGKPIQQARNEVNGACSRINWFTENASHYLSEEWVLEIVLKMGVKRLGCRCLQRCKAYHARCHIFL